MEGQGAQIQRVQNSGEVNQPNLHYSSIFRDNSDGFYYGKLSDGTIEPLMSSVGNGDWKYNGNVVVSEKWIGTIDNFDFPIRANNTEVGRFTKTGSLGVGTTNPSTVLHIDSKQAATIGIFTTENNVGFITYYLGSGSPENVVSAEIGAEYTDIDTGDLYKKTTATVNTGWALLDSNVSNDWNLNGNTVGSIKWIGTIDNFDFPIRSNSTEVGRFTTNGRLGIGITVPLASIHAKGAGDTMGTISFKSENSTNTASFIFKDDGELNILSPLDGASTGIPNVSFTSSTGGILHTYNSNAGLSSQIDFYETGVIKARIQEGAGGIYTIASANRIAWKDLNTNFTKIWVEMASSFVGIGLDFFATSALLHLRGLGATGATYSLKVENSTPAITFSVKDSGLISMPLLQTGNAGLAVGDLYADTAVNILANGDKIIAKKS